MGENYKNCKMKKVLLIGSNGYIGTLLYKKFNKIYNITCIDDCWFNPPPNNVDIIKKDFNSLEKDFIQEYDVIILLAGHSSVKMCEGEFSNAFNLKITKESE